ncbi:PREDICTED: RING-H2 finger protein ATL16-like isoform X2 [Tarenaya hassleriana]|uniref:RING-H2 finger protein ATL16-like isoform X1 n=1 Tax=Tarenaya hassleriana TaxID=28532 RepID=UPI00053C5E2B|nr:PREDICTED: RING-H2 finger protein ATL16-like isoform X1 [Tarenaya hassleriana]XP_010556899.1 PREDICTED: RING-H2 finger protein ATL16-like isoform X2 [Tarenaya hassleriana]
MDPSNPRNPFINLAFPPPPVAGPIFRSSGTSFPILAVAIIGILATAFLLVSYYVFVIKCCLNWDRIDLLRRFSLSRRRNGQDPLMVYYPAIRNCGLDESAIRAIPIFKFKKRDGGGEAEEKSCQECSVCLNEFEEDEKLRIIPNCCHLFHIDCIDIWLQNNANCPLCRTSVSCDTRFPPDQIPGPFPGDPNSSLNHGTLVRGDSEFVVIELGTRNNGSSARNQSLLAEQERSNLGQVTTGNTPCSVSPSPMKIDQGPLRKKGRKFHKVTSMGDECIDIRGKDNDQFRVQPIRRSISMDSSADQQLYLAVQEAINRQNRQVPVVGDGGCSSSSGNGNGNVSNRVKRSFFSFGSSRGSRSSILPVYLDP